MFFSETSPDGVEAVMHCTEQNYPCGYLGPLNDPTGERHNNLSLATRLGLMVHKHEIILGIDPHLRKEGVPFWYWLEPGEDFNGRHFNSRDEAIRDAWKEKQNFFPKGFVWENA